MAAAVSWCAACVLRAAEDRTKVTVCTDDRAHVSLSQALSAPPMHATHAVGRGPRAAQKAWSKERMTVCETNAWMEKARREAILGGCRRSMDSVKSVCFRVVLVCTVVVLLARSGIQCYIAFVRAVKGGSVVLWPPKLDWLLAWAMLFRNRGTFSNYLGYVKIGCFLERVDVVVLSHPAIRRAKESVSKAGRCVSREKCWIRRHRIEAMLRWASAIPDAMQFAVLFLMCYVFLLRMPSEALPMIVGDGSEKEVAQSVVWVDPVKKEIVLKLGRRKNKEQGSRLVRTCWCKECPRTCPVHVLGPLIKNSQPGEALFAGISSQAALCKLRVMLAAIGVEKSECYRSHDMRRGHALDLQCAGAPLWQILEAGEWSSPAFLRYLDLHRLDTELVVQAHAGESDSDDSDVD